MFDSPKLGIRYGFMRLSRFRSIRLRWSCDTGAKSGAGTTLCPRILQVTPGDYVLDRAAKNFRLPACGFAIPWLMSFVLRSDV
jgi:hypothetical protein